MTRAAALVLVLAASCGSPPPPEAPPVAPRPAASRPAPPPVPTPAPPPKELVLGPLVVTLSTSRTAQVFHVVDALSAWGPGVRPSPYVPWAKNELGLDDADRAMLAEHAKLRQRRGWGALDRTFLVDEGVEDAAFRALGEHWLTRADADRERALLTRFAAKLGPMLDAQRATVEAFEAQARAAIVRAAPVGEQVARLLAADEKRPLPVFLAADPSPMRAGGGTHAGRLVVEVLAADGPQRPLVGPEATLLHELFHAMLADRRETLAVGARKCDEPLDEETLTEGLAYAIAPGLVHPDGGDPLADLVAADRALPLRAPLVRFERLGLALRAPLQKALGEGASLRDVVPIACDAWASVVNAQVRR